MTSVLPPRSWFLLSWSMAPNRGRWHRAEQTIFLPASQLHARDNLNSVLHFVEEVQDVVNNLRDSFARPRGRCFELLHSPVAALPPKPSRTYSHSLAPMRQVALEHFNLDGCWGVRLNRVIGQLPDEIQHGFGKLQAERMPIHLEVPSYSKPRIPQLLPRFRDRTVSLSVRNTGLDGIRLLHPSLWMIEDENDDRVRSRLQRSLSLKGCSFGIFHFLGQLVV